MANIYTKEVIATAKAEIGYQAKGKNNKYAKDLDAVGFYNTKKNGYADFCTIFVDWCVWKNTAPQTADNARAIVYEPNKDNCGAGCAQKVSYFKAHKAWYSKCQDAHEGDEIFFKSSSYVSAQNPLGVYHTGIVVAWDGKGLYVVEANTSGGKTLEKFYKYSDPKIAGFGRPKYTAYERPEVKPEPEPAPDPIENPDLYSIKVRKLYYNKSFVMVGDDVGTVQDIVGAKQDKNYGPETEKCVNAWKSAHGLPANGIWDSDCWTKSTAY